MPKKKLEKLVNNLVGDEGFKTDVVVTVTNASVVKTAVGLILAAGISAVLWHMARNLIGNAQLRGIQDQLTGISEQLKQTIAA